MLASGPDRMFTFSPPWSRAPLHVVAFRCGRQRATVAVTGAQVLSDAEWKALAPVLDRDVMYDLAPDAAWTVLELHEAHGMATVSTVQLLGPEGVTQECRILRHE